MLSTIDGTRIQNVRANSLKSATMRRASVYLWTCCILATINGSHNLLKAVIESGTEYKNILRVMSEYDNFMNLNNFVLFAGHFDEDKTSLQQCIMEFTGRSIIIAGSQTGPLYKIINSYNLAVVVYSGIHDPILNVVNTTLDKISHIPFLFVYKAKDGRPLAYDDIISLFNWCLKNLYHLVVLIDQNADQGTLWSYTMKDTMVIYAITQSDIDNLKNRKYKLLNQYHVTISLFQRLPYAFVINSAEQHDLTGHKHSLAGQTGIMLAEFIRSINGTMEILYQSNGSYCSVITKCIIEDKSIDIGANLVDNTELALFSPLVMPTKYCLVVPFMRRVAPSKYFQVLFGNTTVLAYWALYIITMSLIRRFINPHMPAANLILETVQVSWGQNLPVRVFSGMGISEKILTISTWIYNILMTTACGSAFATILTTGIYMPKIVDIESFVANDINIMVTHDQMKEILKMENVPREFMDRVITVDPEILDRHLNSLNDSYVYLMGTHRFALIEFMQQRLLRPKLKLAPEPLCTLHRFLRLPIRQDLGLATVLSRFVDDVTESGLTAKWMRMGLEQLKHTNIIQQAPYEQSLSKPLTLSFFTFGLQVYCTGMLLSGIVLLIECVYGYWRKRFNNYGNVIIV